MLGVPEAARLIRIALSVRDASGGEPVQPRGDFVWGRETVHKRLSISERTLLAIQEFEQRFLDVNNSSCARFRAQGSQDV